MLAESVHTRDRPSLDARHLRHLAWKRGGRASPRCNSPGHLLSQDRAGAERRTQRQLPFGRGRMAKIQRSRLTSLSSRVSARTGACVAYTRPAFARRAFRMYTVRTTCADERHSLRQDTQNCLRNPCTLGQGPLFSEPREGIQNQPHPRCLSWKSYLSMRAQLSPHSI